MNSIISLIGVAIITAVTSIFLKQYRPEFSIVVTAIGSAIIILICVDDFKVIGNELNEIFRAFNVDKTILSILIKSLGICVLTDFCSNLCNDFGQGSLSSKIELAGKVAVTFIILPIIKEIINVAVELIN